MYLQIKSPNRRQVFSLKFEELAGGCSGKIQYNMIYIYYSPVKGYHGKEA